MDELLVESLSKRFRIAKEPIIREEYEIIFLQALMSSKLAKKLIFKGGTALRLAYGSPRFSEDLDFSLSGEIKQEDFGQEVKKMVKGLSAVKIKELTEKRYTHFAVLKIKERYLKQPFSIKIEVSKRSVKWKMNKDYTGMVLKSQVAPLETIGFVITLERAFTDKRKMIKERDKARDLFDLWWLGQKLGRKIEIKLSQRETQKVKAELNRFLPEPAKLIVESWRRK